MSAAATSPQKRGETPPNALGCAALPSPRWPLALLLVLGAFSAGCAPPTPPDRADKWSRFSRLCFSRFPYRSRSSSSLTRSQSSSRRPL